MNNNTSNRIYIVAFRISGMSDTIIWSIRANNEAEAECLLREYVSFEEFGKFIKGSISIRLLRDVLLDGLTSKEIIEPKCDSIDLSKYVTIKGGQNEE